MSSSEATISVLPGQHNDCRDEQRNAKQQDRYATFYYNYRSAYIVSGCYSVKNWYMALIYSLYSRYMPMVHGNITLILEQTYGSVEQSDPGELISSFWLLITYCDMLTNKSY